MNNEQNSSWGHLLRKFAREAVVFSLIGLFFVLAADFVLDSGHVNPAPKPKEEIAGGHQVTSHSSVAIMPDDAQNILAPLQIDNGTKTNAWQAFKDSSDERELAAKLQNLDLPQNIKADLWEAKRRASIAKSQEQLDPFTSFGGHRSQFPEFIPYTPPTRGESQPDFIPYDLGAKPVGKAMPSSKSRDIPDVSDLIADMIAGRRFQELSPRGKRMAPSQAHQ